MSKRMVNISKITKIINKKPLLNEYLLYLLQIMLFSFFNPFPINNWADMYVPNVTANVIALKRLYGTRTI